MKVAKPDIDTTYGSDLAKVVENQGEKVNQLDELNPDKLDEVFEEFIAENTDDAGRFVKGQDEAAKSLERKLDEGIECGEITKIPTWKVSGPAPGVLGINGNSISNAAIKNYYPEEGIEFVFDAQTNTFVVGKPHYSDDWGSPHQKLADLIGANQNADTTLGGIFSRGANGEIYTNENSGHFGMNWTPELRERFMESMKRYGLEVIHEAWK